MAEASGNVPTFKLVLVGDGGTGKVRLDPACEIETALRSKRPMPGPMANNEQSSLQRGKKLTASLCRPPSSSAI